MSGAQPLPARGTRARAILEYLYNNVPAHSGHQISTIKVRSGINISDEELRSFLSSGRKSGWVRVQGRNGFTLTSTARSAIADDMLVNAIRPCGPLKPIDKKHIPSPLGMREGSNDHLSWPSKFDE
jgi:hypothetical protein